MKKILFKIFHNNIKFQYSSAISVLQKVFEWKLEPGVVGYIMRTKETDNLTLTK